VPVAFVVLYYALALGLGPGGMAWLAVLLAAGGHVTAGAALALSVVGGCLVATVAVAFARRRIERTGAAEAPAPRTRGPATYAGPGSLGGTESALRR
jgi:hypothetical protein